MAAADSPSLATTRFPQGRETPENHNLSAIRENPFRRAVGGESL